MNCFSILWARTERRIEERWKILTFEKANLQYSRHRIPLQERFGFFQALKIIWLAYKFDEIVKIHEDACDQIIAFLAGLT